MSIAQQEFQMPKGRLSQGGVARWIARASTPSFLGSCFVRAGSFGQRPAATAARLARGPALRRAVGLLRRAATRTTRTPNATHRGASQN